MDGGIAEPVGNLGEIQLVGADKLFGSINFHPGKKFNDSAMMNFLKKPLQLGAADQGVLADFFNCQLFGDMFFHVADNPVVGFVGTSQRRLFVYAGWDGTL